MPPAHQPKYSHYKPKDLAYVWLGGKRLYLGKHNSKESWAKYYQALAEHAAGTPEATRPDKGKPTLTVGQLVERYQDHAGQYYGRSGEVPVIAHALGPVRDLYGSTLAAEFGPLLLRAVREEMIRRDFARTVINSRVDRVRRMFRWAASMELVPTSVVEALRTVEGLRSGKTTARETEAVGPVPVETVKATLPHLSRPVAGMVHLQMLTGMRPGEVRAIRMGDLDRTGEVWVYRPGSLESKGLGPGKHKTAWRGKQRAILIGPKGQAVIRAFEQVDPKEPLFSPREAVRLQTEQRRASRQTKLYPCEVAKRAERPGAKHNAAYSSAAYKNAIDRACQVAKVDPWTPNQLRHTAATLIRARFGLEAAQAVLGHARADVTQIYAERDLAKAREVIGEIG